MKRTGLLFLSGLLAACGGPTSRPPERPPEPPAPARTQPTPDETRVFVHESEQQLRALSIAASVADWEASTNITPQTEQESARAEAAVMAFVAPVVRETARHRGVPDLSEEVRRKLTLLSHATELPAPRDAQKRDELAELSARMESLYGKGKYCAEGKQCRDLEQLSETLATSRDPAVLRDAWEGWHAEGKNIGPLYARYVALANEGARELGHADLGALWRSRYDVEEEAFAADYDRLWGEVKPLYDALHCHVRAKLRARYGAKQVPEKGPIPAHLLGNMWAQDWSNLYRELTPYPGLGELDVTPALVRQQYDAERMVKLGEAFFTSLGLPRLPESFWQRSMLTRPKDREVVCHASAWDVLYNDDLRIKMCTRVNQEDLLTIHHELGHIYYFSQYYQLPFLFQQGANEAFHEAIGDTIALSVTPAYLKQVGLLEKVPQGEQGAVNQLMQRALEKVAFLPFGKVVDAWRWKVFAGEIAPADYNRTWWEMRTAVQGVAPPGPRPDDAFDPGAKYHVPANVSYARYFLAAVLQYQFHRGLCKIAGHQGPLYACSIHGNQAAGDKLAKMLALGASKPWPDALAQLTGERTLDATAILDYFAPLKAWLDQQNQGRSCGW
ncbi:MAG: M2 family metallopeptidase [Polyangiales bacterium]